MKLFVCPTRHSLSADRQEVRALGLSLFLHTVIDSILIKALSFMQIIFRSYQVVCRAHRSRAKNP